MKLIHLSFGKFIFLASIVTLCFLPLVSMKNITKSDKKYENLIKWVKENGGAWNKIEVKEMSEGNRHVAANENITKNENITVVPEKIILSDENHLIKPTCEKFNTTGVTCLAIYICQELNKNNSFFKPYFDTLPNDFQSYPLFYTDQELRLLRGSMMEDYIQSWRMKYTEDYNSINNPEFSLDNYMKCRIIIRSRNFFSGFNGKETNMVVPLSDLFNFKPSGVKVKSFYDNLAHAFVIQDQEDIKSGEEVFIDYGDESNVYYLFHYGFAVEKPNQAIDYRFNYEGNEISLMRRGKDLLRSIKYARKGASENISSLEEEKRAIIIFRSQLIKRLNNYSTRLKDDLGQIQNEKVKKNSNFVNIYRILIEEKQVKFYLNIKILLHI